MNTAPKPSDKFFADLGKGYAALLAIVIATSLAAMFLAVAINAWRQIL